MFRVKFNKSKSKNYDEVVKLAGYFNEYVFVNDRHIIDIPLKELFEKWEYFNLIFWKTDNWIGSTFGYNDFDIHTKEAKKRLFYAVQQAHSMWLNLSVAYLRQLAPIYFEDSFDEEIRNEVFNQEDVDRILDLLLAEKHRIIFREKFNNIDDERF